MTTEYLPGWYADDGNCEAYYPDAKSAQEAAQEYVDGGDWGCEDGTAWIDVGCWRRFAGDDEDTDHEKEWVQIRIDPDEPNCSAQEHDWTSPDDGFNGVRGHGGGVIYTETCSHCELARTTDTWAHDAQGRQGLTAISYGRSGE